MCGLKVKSLMAMSLPVTIIVCGLKVKVKSSMAMSLPVTIIVCGLKVKVKSLMARSLPVENLLPQNVGSIMNYLQ